MNKSLVFPYHFILKHIIWKCFVICATLLWCLFALATLPISVIFFIFLHIYRYTVAKTTGWYRKDLGKMLTTTSSMVAASGVHTHPQETIILTFIIKGEPPTEEISSFILNRLVSCQKEKSLMYPELQQYVTPHLGYLFWKWEKNFSIKDHLKVYNESGSEDLEGKLYTTTSGLLDLRQKFLRTTFPPKISPWQFVVVRDFTGDGKSGVGEKQTAIIFRIHHCLVDGFSLLKMIMTQFAGRSMKEIPNPPKIKVNPLRVLFKTLQFAVVKTFQMIYSWRILWDKNDWHRRFTVQSEYNCSIIQPFTLEAIHRIKNNAEVSFTTVVLAIVTGVVRKMMMRKQARLPKTLRLGYPFPRPGHPDKLRNHFTAAMIDLPVGTEDPLARIQLIGKGVNAIKNDLVTPQFFTGYTLIIGGFFHWLLPPFASHYLYTGGLTNFPGPREAVSFCGGEAVAADLCISIPRGNIAFGVGAISYKDKMHMSFQLNKSLVNDEEKNLLQNFVSEEIALLTSCSTQNSPTTTISITND